MKIENNVLIEVTDGDIVDGTIEFPTNITEISDYAFCGCRKLKSTVDISPAIEVSQPAVKLPSVSYNNNNNNNAVADALMSMMES